MYSIRGLRGSTLIEHPDRHGAVTACCAAAFGRWVTWSLHRPAELLASGRRGFAVDFLQTPSSLRPLACFGGEVRIAPGALLGGTVKRMIAIVDLKTGEVLLRSSDTSTLDVPADLDRDAGVAQLIKSHAHYFSTSGKSVSGSTFPRPLSWRVRGEECLLAEPGDTRVDGSSYTLVAVDPTEA